MPVVVEAGHAIQVDADPDQIEQALINLLKTRSMRVCPAMARCVSAGSNRVTT